MSKAITPHLTLLAAFFLIGQSPLKAAEVQGLVLPFKQVSLSSPIQDIIKETSVQEGDEVKEGQIVVQLMNEKEALEAEQYAKMIDKRMFDASGAETLFHEKMGSKESMLQKQTDLELSKIQHRMAQVRFNDKAIRAPLSGIVVKKYKESGESIDRVEKLMDIVNIDKVYIQFYVDPKLVFLVKLDQKIPVHFPLLGSSRPFPAVVAFVDPRIDAGSGLCRIKLVLDNPEHQIRPGMRGEADFSVLKGS